MARSKVPDEEKIILIKAWVKKKNEAIVRKEIEKLETKYKK